MLSSLSICPSFLFIFLSSASCLLRGSPTNCGPLLTTHYWLTSLCQGTRRMDDESLEEQIRQTSEDSRALRELMEGERGKLRQSLEELQQLHSQVSTPISQCRPCIGPLPKAPTCVRHSSPPPCSRGLGPTVRKWVLTTDSHSSQVVLWELSGQGAVGL